MSNCLGHFLFLACTNIWVPGNEFSMSRSVYAFAARVRARADAVAVLHSTRKHVRSCSSYSTHLTRSQSLVPARGIAYANITHNVIPLTLRKCALFSKSEDHIFSISAPSFDKNNRHTTHTVTRGAIIFQAEKAAPVTLLLYHSLLICTRFGKFGRENVWKMHRFCCLSSSLLRHLIIYRDCTFLLHYSLVLV